MKLKNMKLIVKQYFPIYLLVALSFTVISCGRIIDGYLEEKAKERYTSPFMGKWVGTYTGDESGSLSITVAKSGQISGVYGPYNDEIFNSVSDDGVLGAISSNNPMFFYFHGNLITKKGTWRRSNLKGEWTITKQ